MSRDELGDGRDALGEVVARLVDGGEGRPEARGNPEDVGRDQGRGKALDGEEPVDERIDVLLDGGGEAGRTGNRDNLGDELAKFTICNKPKPVSSRREREERSTNH